MVLSTISLIYPLTAYLLFFILSNASFASFHLLHIDLKESVVRMRNNQDLFHKKHTLQTLKSRYFLALDTADCINHVLGWTLLLWTLFTFVAIINSMFYLCWSSESTFSLESVPDILFCTFPIIHLFYMCYSAENIRNKVN